MKITFSANPPLILSPVDSLEKKELDFDLSEDFVFDENAIIDY